MIRDTDGNALLSAYFPLESEDVQIFQIQVDCRDGEELRAGVSDVTIEARVSGIGSYANITDSPLDLSAYDGETKTFDIRLTAPEVTAFERQRIVIANGRPTAPRIPEGLTLSTPSANIVKAEWYADEADATGYELRKTVGAVVTVADVGFVDTHSYNLGSAGIETTLEIRAYNAAGYSAWSEAESITSI